ncbi:MAG: sulfite exporter TauE/SafE family protein [Candidatus Woesearchaeota archaeon]
MEPLEFALFALIGMGTGFLSGLFGIGGGSIRIPLLMMMGLPIVNAYATNMIAISFSSGTAALVQRKNIDWKMAYYVMIGGVIGVGLATLLVGIISPIILAWIFLFASIVTTLGLYLESISPKLSGRIHPNKTNVVSGIFFLNFIIGLRGGSGGTLFPPFLHMMHLEMHRAIATSLMASFVTGTVATLIYIFRGDVLWMIALIVGIFDILGAYAGGRVSLRSASSFLKAGLAILVFMLAVYVVYSQYALR